MINELLMREEIRVLLFLMAPFTLVAVLLIVFWLIGNIRFRNKQRTWQKTNGHIVSADVKDDGDNGYYPGVVYEYAVAGKSYQADRLALGVVMTQGDRAKIEQKLADYPSGKQVEVYYNPKNPAKAVLEMQARSNRGLLFGAILIFVLVGIISTVWILAADPDSFLQPILAQLNGGE